MKFGIAIFPTDYGIRMTELAPAVEERGFESLWVAEHSHIHVSDRPLGPTGAPLPQPYWHTLDPFVALTAAALATRRLRIGTGVCLLVQRDPIHTAKLGASLDLLSEGRFLFGVGGGWNRAEMADHGTAYETRWRLLRERVEAVKEIWTSEEAEYHGRFVDFDRMWCWPKPVQKPHPPVILGGNGPNTLKRVVRYADGWMPNRGDVLSRIPELQRLAREAGRDPIPVTVYGETAEPAEVERYLEAGVERIIYYVPSDGRDASLRRLEELTGRLRPYLAHGS
ncbi:MAG TPA: LLM class F420-dependent oxidoreductase [Candidatus Dormibacteraeota bacterium]|nr:LLM class F420-dependent oxidoreductase [Candidatus Dormibacteraeota bacterium]